MQCDEICDNRDSQCVCLTPGLGGRVSSTKRWSISMSRQVASVKPSGQWMGYPTLIFSACTMFFRSSARMHHIGNTGQRSSNQRLKQRRHGSPLHSESPADPLLHLLSHAVPSKNMTFSTGMLSSSTSFVICLFLPPSTDQPS